MGNKKEEVNIFKMYGKESTLEKEEFIKTYKIKEQGLTDKEVEDDSLNLIDMLLDTEKDVDPLKRRLVNIINKAVNDEATLDDIVEVVLKNKKKFQK